MNPETEAVLKKMGMIPFDSSPDRDDGTITYFMPEATRRPRFSIKIFPTTSPAGVCDAIWQAGREEMRCEIATARAAYLTTLHA